MPETLTFPYGNVILLEHVNTAVPDQQLATSFYVSGLGLTRDPYMSTGIENMWINVGRSQFHLPTAPAQLVRGHVGVVVPDLAALLRRLAAVKAKLASTCFDFAEREGHVEAISPWGNRYRCHLAGPSFGADLLGIAYVEFDVPAASAAGIAAFYRDVIGAPTQVVEGTEGPCACVSVGEHQALRFRETSAPLPDYDGHHIQVYVAEFDAVHDRLQARDLVTEPIRSQQFRFEDIVDPASGASLYRLEHEVRSTSHRLYRRPLVNRNAAQTNANYVPGSDALQWESVPRHAG